MRLVARATWGARPPTTRTLLVKAAQKGTAVHYSGSDSDEQEDHNNCARRVKGIQTFHMDGRGWADIAYSYLVCKHGWTFEGRGLGTRTAAQGTTSGNDAYHAVCFLGDDSVQRDDVTDAGRRALRDTVMMCNGWTTHSDTIRPHSWFHPTGCPGDQLRAWISQGMPAPSLEGFTIMDSATREYLDKMFQLVRVGDRQGGETDTHDFSSLEGVTRQIRAFREEVTTRLAAIEAKLPSE